MPPIFFFFFFFFAEKLRLCYQIVTHLDSLPRAAVPDFEFGVGVGAGECELPEGRIGGTSANNQRVHEANLCKKFIICINLCKFMSNSADIKEANLCKKSIICINLCKFLSNSADMYYVSNKRWDISLHFLSWHSNLYRIAML